MPALTINGVTIPAAAREGTHQAPVTIGSDGARVFGGGLTSGVRDRKDAYRFRTTPRTLAEATSLRAWIQGEGHSWSFDDSTFFLYADGTGYGPLSSEDDAVRATSSPTPAFGDGYARVTGTLGYMAISVPARTFLALWRRDTAKASPSWDHWMYNGGVKYKNGVQTAVATPWLSVSDPVRLYAEETAAALSTTVFAYTAGAGPAAVNNYVTATTGGIKYLYLVTISGSPATFNGAGTPTATFNATFTDSAGYTFRNVGVAWGLYDDLLYLPSAVPTGWISQIYTEASARAWTPRPNLRVDGTLLSSVALTMKGRLGDSPLGRFGFSGALASGEPVDFSLEEV